jgi:hypothetical protein
VVQLALGSRKQGALIHFAFGAQEWRLFRGVMALVGFLLLLVLLVTTGIVFLLSANGGLTAGGKGLGAVFAIAALLFVALVFFILRFGMLLPAVAVSENGPLLPRAWALSAGNFWRMLGVAAAIVIPVYIFSTLILVAIVGQQAAMPSPQISTAMMAAQFHGMAMNMPLVSGIEFLFAPVWLGLLVGAGASVYRSVNLNRPVDEIA